MSLIQKPIQLSALSLGAGPIPPAGGSDHPRSGAGATGHEVWDRFRYYSYSDYLKHKFGGKTYKIVVSSGLTCPTRDGTLAKRGCAFCDVRGSSSYFGKRGRGAEIRQQIETRLPEIKKRFQVERFLAYFQSYTNTYSDAEYLRSIYEAALENPEIKGLCVGTRPDCLPESVVELLDELSRRTILSLELGVQSLENPTLEWLRRGHDAESSIQAIKMLRTKAPEVQVCVHLIFGSPTDSPEAAKNAALLLSELGVHGVKLHQLMVLENTELAERYRESPFFTPSIEEYADIVGTFVEHLSPNIYIERLCATASHSDECLAPAWSKDRWTPHNRIRDILGERGCQQGSRVGAG